jgi:predicted permease
MSLLSRFVGVFRSERVNREIEEEQEFHIGCRIAELIEEGMAPEAATRRARLEFGNRLRAREESHDVKLFGWLESTGQDLLYGFRTLRKSPSFAAAAILTLALGIGANTAIFSVLSTVLLNPLPYPQPNELVCLFEEIPNFKNGSISYPNFLDWQRMNRTFSGIAAYRPTAYNLLDEGEPEHLQGEMISAGFFEILGVKPVIGRTFNKDDDHLGAAPVAMISEGLWKGRFGSSRDIIGRRLVVNGVGHTIIGVMPTLRLQFQNFQRGGPPNDIYTPIGQFSEARFHTDRSSGWGMDALGRLKPGLTLLQAREDMDRVSRQLTATYPDADTYKKANLVPLKKAIVGDIQPALLLLFGAVFFVLLIACANLANLLLARSTSRQREFAIRAALGASRTRLIRQLLTESVLRALIGGGLGLLLAKFGTAAAIAAMPESLPRAEEIGLDLRVLLFALLISLVTGIAFGLAPVLRLRFVNVGGALKESGRTFTGTHRRTQRVFVAVEMALALTLLVGAGLMIRTLFVLWNVDPGFNPRDVMTFSVAPPSLANENPAAIHAFLRQMHLQIASTPGVQAASLIWGATPMGSDSESDFWFAGRPKPAQRAFPMAITYIVEPGYFRTLQIPLKRGRFLTERDDEHSPVVVVIDESLAKKYFPGEDPIGQYLDFNTDPSQASAFPIMRIVGIVGHVNQWGLAADAASPLHAQMYLPIAQLPDQYARQMAYGLGVVVRSRNALTASFETLRNRLLPLSRGLALFDPEPMERAVSKSIAGRRFVMSLFAVFAGLALFLANIGIYGVLSYFVGQRTQEIGVRMALGAAPSTVLRMTLKDGALMILAGIAAGVIASLALVNLISSLLFGVKPTDLPTFVVVVGVLCSIGFLACYVPARRAMKIDPVVALREE